MSSTLLQTSTRDGTLSRNLACLGERHADLARLLRAEPPADIVRFEPTPQEVPSGLYEGAALCSRHRPLEEADRLIANIDLVEHAVVCVLGFGLGYHVQALAQRMRKAGVIVVFEPDVALLRAVLARIDHSAWLKESLILFITDAADRGVMAARLDGAEAIIAQGVAFLEHPASRARLAASSPQFLSTFQEFVAAAKTTLMTTLMRSADTIQNLMLNVDHYVSGPGIGDLKNCAAQKPAIIVSAGPSFRRNAHLLSQPGVRDRCVIIAVQTMLKPLLQMGVRPHFVTALDYHEISRRFYEGLTASDIEGITLVAEPKVHPAVLDAFPAPGVIRCCASSFLDELLGNLKKDMGALPCGATVAHLAVYLAEFLGCNPIALIGQDLGFTDGLYYTPGTAIHDVWAPELNPFNTIEMMEWQRIVRHRTHLRKIKDVRGKSIFTDLQMHTYLQQFERDFARLKESGVTVIDASEGGAVKQHAQIMPLAEVLASFATAPLDPIPEVLMARDPARLAAARSRLARVRADVNALRETSIETASLLKKMIDDQADASKMQRHFARMDKNRKKVEQRMETFQLLNQLNQLGVFKRLKADRRLHMQAGMPPLVRQKAQLERDLVNVNWIADAAQEMVEQLLAAEALLDGKGSGPASATAENKRISAVSVEFAAPPARVAALLAIDPDRSGLGIVRRLDATFAGRTVLQATLERLGASRELESIIILTPDGFDVERLIDRSKIALPVEIDRCGASLFGDEQRAIAAARLWGGACWRGGIGGMSIYDEVLAPKPMHEALERRSLTAALVAGPDWPLIDVLSAHGCDAVIARHREHPQEHRLVFTQAPPGLCGCLVNRQLMGELAMQSRLATVGALLVYQPHAPQGDPIARDCNVQIPPALRHSLVRATFDSADRQRAIRAAAESSWSADGDLIEWIKVLENQAFQRDFPQHLILELCSHRRSTGRFAASRRSGDRPPMTRQVATEIFRQIAVADDVVVSFSGFGDPLLHDEFDAIMAEARSSGVRGIHVRTELLSGRRELDRLIACDVDVISIDLHADRAATYQAMMGTDSFKQVLLNMEYLAANRRVPAGTNSVTALATPWIIPRIQRCATTYEDIDSFYDRWVTALGGAIIESPPPDAEPRDELIEAAAPPQVIARESRRRMTILSDGSVPVSEFDRDGSTSVGSAEDRPLTELWKSLQNKRELLMSQPSPWMVLP